MKINETNMSFSGLTRESRGCKALYTAGFRNKFGMTGSGETGRSMVEMLGVLAIVGVLSLIGILGYNIAMRRYQANEIANTAVTLMVLAHAANAGEGGCMQLSTSNLSEYPGGVHVDIIADTVADGVLDIKLMGSNDGALCSAVEDLLGGTNGAECNLNRFAYYDDGGCSSD